MQLASLLFVEAWLDDPAKLVFDRAELAKLQTVLEHYVSVLPTRRPASPAPTPAATASTPSLWQSLWTQYGLTLALGVLFFGLPRLWQSLTRFFRGAANASYLLLQRQTEGFLEYLAYTDARENSRTWAFDKLTIGSKRTLTARSMTLESLTARYLDFAKLARGYYNGRLVVTVDELDKMVKPDDVKSFLIELKGALAEPGCFYLFSISEDAARAFRSRLAEGPDIFDSTFDMVVDIDRLTPELAEALLRKRFSPGEHARFSADAILLLTLFAGGVPRELIRLRSEVSLSTAFRETIELPALALFLFADAVAAWRRRVPELPVSGEAAVRLSKIADDLATTARSAPPRPDWPPEAGKAISAALDVVDPKRLRFSAQAPTGDEVVVLKEVQHVARLLILDVLMTLVWKDGPWRERSGELLDAFRVLPDQPALALAIAATVLPDGAAILSLTNHRRPRGRRPPNPRAA